MKTYNLEGLKDSLGWMGVIMIVLGIIMMMAVPIVISNRGELYRSIRGHYQQAVQAATPTEFAQGLRALDQTLQEAGMVKGNTNVPWFSATGPQDDIAFQRARIQALASRAEQLAVLPLISTEVNTGLADLHATVLKITVSSYGFWLWNQGGARYQFFIPFILIGSGIAFLILMGKLPSYVRRRSGAQPSPA